MVKIKASVILGMVILASGCSQQQPEAFTVDVFKLDTTELANRDAAMVRGDQNFVLYGKVSEMERFSSRGHYYAVTRIDTSLPAKVVFRYQQAATQSKVLQREVSLEPGENTATFQIAEDDYISNGRVLAWKIDLLEAGKKVASEQSYMWE